jgi:hypothetical protein
MWASNIRASFDGNAQLLINSRKGGLALILWWN